MLCMAGDYIEGEYQEARIIGGILDAGYHSQYVFHNCTVTIDSI